MARRAGRRRRRPDMVKRGVAKRGEVWLATLDPTVGSEIQDAPVRHRLARRTQRRAADGHRRADDDGKPPRAVSRAGAVSGEKRAGLDRTNPDARQCAVGRSPRQDRSANTGSGVAGVGENICRLADSRFRSKFSGLTM